jgi:hypothetical protein
MSYAGTGLGHDGLGAFMTLGRRCEGKSDPGWYKRRYESAVREACERGGGGAAHGGLSAEAATLQGAAAERLFSLQRAISNACFHDWCVQQGHQIGKQFIVSTTTPGREGDVHPAAAAASEACDVAATQALFGVNQVHPRRYSEEAGEDIAACIAKLQSKPMRAMRRAAPAAWTAPAAPASAALPPAFPPHRYIGPPTKPMRALRRAAPAAWTAPALRGFGAEGEGTNWTTVAVYGVSGVALYLFLRGAMR